MIDTSNNVGSLVASVLGERKPEPVEQPTPVRDAPARSPRQSTVPATPEELESLRQLQAHLETAGDPAHDLPVGLRTRRALAAYTVTQQIEERDYVTRLLGVDEKV